tara:strand:+ start:347 stop:1030 length:684 start_codon:yes stop_codon:yes gene_type:complete
MSWFSEEWKRQEGGKWADNLKNMFGGGEDDDGPSESEQAAAAAADLKIKRDKAVADLETDLGGFDDDYFKNIGRKYSNFAMNAPVTGIRDQRSTAMDELIAQLSRQGMLNSTVRTDREALAKKLFGKAQVDARREGTRIGRGVEKEFQGQKTLALQDIASATDPASSANASMGSIMSSTKPGTFDPMLDVFLKLTQGLAMRQEVERRKDRQAQLDTFYGTDSAKYHS